MITLQLKVIGTPSRILCALSLYEVGCGESFLSGQLMMPWCLCKRCSLLVFQRGTQLYLLAISFRRCWEILLSNRWTWTSLRRWWHIHPSGQHLNLGRHVTQADRVVWGRVLGGCPQTEKLETVVLSSVPLSAGVQNFWGSGQASMPCLGKWKTRDKKEPGPQRTHWIAALAKPEITLPVTS